MLSVVSKLPVSIRANKEAEVRAWVEQKSPWRSQNTLSTRKHRLRQTMRWAFLISRRHNREVALLCDTPRSTLTTLGDLPNAVLEEELSDEQMGELWKWLTQERHTHDAIKKHCNELLGRVPRAMAAAAQRSAAAEVAADIAAEAEADEAAEAVAAVAAAAAATADSTDKEDEDDGEFQPSAFTNPPLSPFDRDRSKKRRNTAQAGATRAKRQATAGAVKEDSTDSSCTTSSKTADDSSSSKATAHDSYTSDDSGDSEGAVPYFCVGCAGPIASDAECVGCSVTRCNVWAHSDCVGMADLPDEQLDSDHITFRCTQHWRKCRLGTCSSGADRDYRFVRCRRCNSTYHFACVQFDEATALPFTCPSCANDRCAMNCRRAGVIDKQVCRPCLDGRLSSLFRFTADEELKGGCDCCCDGAL